MQPVQHCLLQCLGVGVVDYGAGAEAAFLANQAGVEYAASVLVGGAEVEIPQGGIVLNYLAVQQRKGSHGAALGGGGGILAVGAGVAGVNHHSGHYAAF